MSYIGANNAQSTLAAGLSNTATTLSIQGADIALFPVINNGGAGDDYTYLTLQNAQNAVEVVKVTRHDTASADFLVMRAQDGTNALPWNIGDVVALRITAGMVNDVFAALNAAKTAAAEAASSAGGAAASVNGIDATKLVQTDTAQTVTGAKTFGGPIGIGADWTVQQEGANLCFRYGGEYRLQIDSDGTVRSPANIIAGNP